MNDNLSLDSVIRHLQFNKIQDIFFIDNNNQLIAIRTSDYIFVVWINLANIYDFEIQIKLKYPILNASRFKVSQIDSERVEIELIGLYNEYTIVNFKEIFFLDKTMYAYSYYSLRSGQHEYH